MIYYYSYSDRFVRRASGHRNMPSMRAVEAFSCDDLGDLFSFHLLASEVLVQHNELRSPEMCVGEGERKNV